MSYVFTEYRVKGLNLDRFINTVKRRGITLYEIKKTDGKTINVTVKYKESKKFFAISKELCYNIEKIKDKGRLYPLLYLYKNIGLVVGAIIFIASALFFNDFIFSVEYTGSGSVVKTQVQQYLNDRGIKQYSRFSDIDMATLSSEILASNPRLSFVECQKVGNVLKVNSALSDGSSDTLSGKADKLVSDVDGIVENLKIYRGTAVVKAGDTVKKGDLIVSNQVTVKEQILNINVLAVVTIKCEYEFCYYSQNPGEEQIALALAEESFPGGDISDESVNVSAYGDSYEYKVKLNYRRVLSVG